MFKMLKNQKGMTLVELLAVMVIVGIIAAISIPAIGGLLENTKKDAHLANAKVVQEGLRLFTSGNDLSLSKLLDATKEDEDELVFESTDGKTFVAKVEGTGEAVNVDDLGTYIDNLQDPHNTSEKYDKVIGVVKANTDGTYEYSVALKGSKVHVSNANVASGEITKDNATDAFEMNRTKNVFSNN